MIAYDLPDADAARVFAHDDPLARGGVFEGIMVRWYHNVLGRTMWQFGGDPKNPRFLFIGEALPGASEQGRDLLGAGPTEEIIRRVNALEELDDVRELRPYLARAG